MDGAAGLEGQAAAALIDAARAVSVSLVVLVLAAAANGATMWRRGGGVGAADARR